MTPTRRLTRVEYDTHKAAFIAKLRAELEAQNQSAYTLAEKSRQRALALQTDTSLSPANVYHYLSGVALPTPKKLVELATCLSLRPDELLPKSIMGQRRYVARRFAVAATAHTQPNQAGSTRPFSVSVTPGISPDTANLKVEAVMDPKYAHAWAAALTRKLKILKVAADEGITEQEAEELIAAGAALKERMTT